MTYEVMVEVLKSNHFYPIIQRKLSKNGSVIVALHVDAAPIMMDSKKKRLEEILGGIVKISKMPNDGYLLVKKNK